jgi:surfactin synthase thioesterase subunit
LNLIFLPYAGANLNVYSELIEKFKKKHNFRCTVIEYPGHGKRFKEECLENTNELVEDIFNKYFNDISKTEELKIVGYSMGTLVGYELARKLVQKNYYVSQLLLCAGIPPHKIEYDKSIEKDKQVLLNKIMTYGILTEETLKNEEVRKTFLPKLKSDILLVNNFNRFNGYKLNKIDSSVKVDFFYGINDLTMKYVNDWKKVSDNDVIIHSSNGGHFFLFDDPKKNNIVIEKILFK